MAEMQTAVIGIYPDRSSLEVGVHTLKAAGFRAADISVVYPAHGDQEAASREKQAAASEGAATGASTGAMVGSALGWLAGIGSLAIPGVGPLIAAGPLLAALAGAAAGGAVGGVAGGLVGLGVPEREAHSYQAHLKKGGTLLSVLSDNPYWTHRARQLLESTGARDIYSTEVTTAGAGNSDKTAAPSLPG